MKRLIALMMAAMMLLTACNTNTDDDDYVPYDGMYDGPLETLYKEVDLEYLHRMLTEIHKNAFANISEEDFQAAYDELFAKLPELSDAEYYHALQEFVALIGDAHTMLGIDDDRVDRYAFQTGLGFSVMNIGDSWYLNLVDRADEQYLGMEVLAIDGVPMKEVFTRALKIISYEDEQWAKVQFPSVINYLDTLQYLDVTDSTESVTLRLSDGEQDYDLVIPALTSEQMYAADFATWSEQLEMPVTAPSRGVYYRHLDLGSNTLFIQYNVCAEMEDYPMEQFVADVKEQLDTGNYSKVIVDLRYNTGGNSAILDPMVNLLIEEKEAKGLDLYCLIGRNTFSSGLMNAAYLWSIGATLVGEPTGGAVNAYGEVRVGWLVNMPVIFQYSSNYFEVIPGYEHTTLVPDIEVQSTYEGYVNGVDEEVQYVLGL